MRLFVRIASPEPLHSGSKYVEVLELDCKTLCNDADSHPESVSCDLHDLSHLVPVYAHRRLYSCKPFAANLPYFNSPSIFGRNDKRHHAQFGKCTNSSGWPGSYRLRRCGMLIYSKMRKNQGVFLVGN